MAVVPTVRPTAQPFEAIVWDYDGTLVASRAADEAAVEELLVHDPSAASGVEVFWAHEGEPILTRIELAWPGRGRDILPLFERQAPPHSVAGVRRVLEALHRRDLPLAVVSSRRRAPLLEGLEQTGLRRFFRAVVGLDDVQRPKPDPEGLLKALRALAVAPERSLFVGDSELDIEAGHRAGATAWRAVWTMAPEWEPHTNGTILLSRPAEVLERIDSIG